MTEENMFGYSIFCETEQMAGHSLTCVTPLTGICDGNINAQPKCLNDPSHTVDQEQTVKLWTMRTSGVINVE